MPYQNISYELKDNEKNEIIELINQINQKLPFLINLTPEERMELPKMGDKTIPFVEKALELSNLNPNLVPPYINLDELRKDLELSKSLREILNLVGQLYEKLSDTYTAVGSEAYVSALAFYNSAKSAAKSNVPGTDVIVNELGKRFTGQGKSKSSGNNPNPQ
ncbi:MAG: hypothetical protein NUV92_00015 [Ignavibacteria bacterium]|jgi:arsenate reductase-like glutaredoxin family protein|nr:hypothetical protein [Ignavibacteria bacterium]MDH7528981.1 hypothetical protein [Ignavibacteria bacterium]NPV11236.1 hypothetical protein [Ignavibacteria bacterium]